MEASQIVRLLRFRDPDCSVEEASFRAASTLFGLLLSPDDKSSVRAGFWVGTIDSAPSALSERVRDRSGRVVDMHPTENFMGFELSMVEANTDARSLAESLLVQLDGFTDIVEWPDFLLMAATKSALWKMPGGSALVMFVPTAVATSLTTSKSLEVEIINIDDPEHEGLWQGFRKTCA